MNKGVFMIKFGSNGKEVPTIDFSNAIMYIKSASYYAATLNDLEATLSFSMPVDDFKKIDQNAIEMQIKFYLETTTGMSFLNSISHATIDLKQRSSQGRKTITCKYYFNNMLLAIALGVNSTEYGMHAKVVLKEHNPDQVAEKMQMLQRLINDAAIKYEELTLALHKEFQNQGEMKTKQEIWKEQFMDEWVDYCKHNLENQGLAWFKVKDLAEHNVPDVLN